MDYDEYIYRLIQLLTQDKSIEQPYRNSVISSARRLQLEIRGARTMTNRNVSEDLVYGSTEGCTCKAGVTDNSCPAHGIATRLRKPGD